MTSGDEPKTVEVTLESTNGPFSQDQPAVVVIKWRAAVKAKEE